MFLNHKLAIAGTLVLSSLWSFSLSALDRDDLTREEWQSMQSACSPSKMIAGPASYNRCLDKQLKLLESSSRQPDLSKISADEQASIKSACSPARMIEGPAAYNACVESQLEELDAYYTSRIKNNTKPKISTKPSNLDSNRTRALRIQSLLFELGYDPGPIDGLMGSKTESAIIEFQKEHGYPQTGELGQVLLEHLEDIIAPGIAEQSPAVYKDFDGAQETERYYANTPPILSTFIFQIIGAVFASLLIAIVVKYSTKFVARSTPTYGNAYVASLLALSISITIRTLISASLSANASTSDELIAATGKSILFTLPVSFLITCIAYGAVVKTSGNIRIGIVKGSGVALIQFSIGLMFIVLLLVGDVATK